MHAIFCPLAVRIVSCLQGDRSVRFSPRLLSCDTPTTDASAPESGTASITPRGDRSNGLSTSTERVGALRELLSLMTSASVI